MLTESYQSFLYMEHMEQTEEYLREKNIMENFLNEAKFIENYYLRDNLQIPFITPILSKRANRDKIIEFTGTFIDNHSAQLYTSGPVHIFTFSDKETNFLYGLFNLTKETVLEFSKNMILQTYQGSKAQFHIIREAPHKILITSMLIEALQRGYDDIVQCCELLFGFSEYPLMYRLFWRTGVKEDVMNYTIEHLANKFKAKKVDNLFGLLKYDMNSSVNANSDKLKSGMDHAYIDLIYRVRNQIKNTFKNLAREYYKNHEANASQHARAGKMDDGHLADQDGHTSNIAGIVESTYNKFLSNGVNNHLVKISAEGRQVDKDILIGYLNQIFSTKNNKIYKFIENVVTAYLSKNPASISVGSGEFLNFGLALYRSIGTSKDPLFQELTTILNFWMFNIIDIKKYYTREGTIISYRRAVFDSMVMMINHHN